MDYKLKAEEKIDEALSKLGLAQELCPQIIQSISEVAINRQAILENFSHAYLAETGLKPSEVELVEQMRSTERGTEMVWFFRKRKG